MNGDGEPTVADAASIRINRSILRREPQELAASNFI